MHARTRTAHTSMSTLTCHMISYINVNFAGNPITQCMAVLQIAVGAKQGFFLGAFMQMVVAR